MAAQPAELEDQTTGTLTPKSGSTFKFTWEITNFSLLTRKAYFSRPFAVGIYSWRLLVIPEGRPGHLSLYLAAADPKIRSNGWAISADLSLVVVNRSTPNSSIKYKVRNQNFRKCFWFRGQPKMMTLEKLHNDGFLVNDTLIIQVGLVVKEGPADTSPEMFDSYFSSLEQYISGVNDVPVCCLTSPPDARSPTLEEVEGAKQSLKECLSDLFKRNMKDRLAVALSTLSRAEVGLSVSQKSSVRAFLNRFGEFTSKFQSLEQDNLELELQKLLKDQMFSKMKKYHEQHLTFQLQSKQIAAEEEEWERKMEELSKIKEELSKRKERLESSWEVLMAKSEEAKCKHAEHEMMAKDAEKKKRIAEERMSRSNAAWSSLKSEFILSHDTPEETRKVMEAN